MPQVPAPYRRRFALLDRDGTLIVERNYLSSVEELELLPHALEGLNLLCAQAFALIVITNQSGIGRGLVTVEVVEAIHAELIRQLAAEGIPLEAVYYCPHLPSDNCGCRKPRIGLAERAAKEFGFKLSQSVVIGDKTSDIEFGRNINARTILVRTGYGAEHEATAHPDAIADDLLAAAQRVYR